MATATAITSKNDQAIQLRAEAAALTKDLAQTKEKLEIAQRTLASFESKRQKFVDDAAAGKPSKPGAISALAAEIAEAEIPVEGLTRAVNEKSARLDTVRANLESIEHELRLDAQRAARQTRFDGLAKQGRETTAQIAELFRELIEDKLPELSAVRDALEREFIGVFETGPGDEHTRAARALIEEFAAQLFDGPYLRITRKLLREGWQPRGDRVCEVPTLRRPRR